MPPLLFRCSFGFVHKGGDLIHLNFGNGTAGLVDAAQLDRIALHGADLQRDGRADDERLAGLLQHGNVIQRFVVALVTVGNGFHESGVAQVACPDGGQHLVLLSQSPWAGSAQ